MVAVGLLVVASLVANSSSLNEQAAVNALHSLLGWFGVGWRFRFGVRPELAVITLQPE